jgi:hypothetical protein
MLIDWRWLARIPVITMSATPSIPGAPGGMALLGLASPAAVCACAVDASDNMIAAIPAP